MLAADGAAGAGLDMTGGRQRNHAAQPPDPTREYARIGAAPGLDGMELLVAHYWSHRFAPHAHDGYVVALIEQGAERFRCRGDELLAPAGSIIVIPPGEVHTGERGDAAGWSYRAFYPDASRIDALGAQLGAGRPRFARTLIDDPALFAALRRAHRTLLDAADPLRAQASWTETFGDLLRRHARPGPVREPGAAHRAVARARELLHGAGPLTLEAIAREVGLSPWQLSRTFRRETGMSLPAYRNHVRLAQARQALRSRRSLAEVAALLGFADQAHFTRQFKRAFGITPGRYRAQV